MLHPVLAFHIDSTLPEMAADLAVLAFIAVNAALGWRKGLVRRVLTGFGTFMACLAANYTGNAVATVVNAHDLFTNAWCFIAVFMVVIVMFEILGALYDHQLHQLIVVTFDRTAGVIAGAVVGFFQIALIFVVAIAASQAPGAAQGNTHGLNADAIQNATLGEYIGDLKPGILAVFAPVLPSNLPDHLNTDTATNPADINGTSPSPTPS